jgi:hypothetical protein
MRKKAMSTLRGFGKFAVASALACLATASTTAPPGPRIAVQAGIAISADAPQARHVESVLAVNPRDSRNRIAASIVLGQRDGIAVYASSDGGRSWVRGLSEPDSGSTFDGLDPALAFDSEGVAYLVTLGPEVAAWTSRDGGRTWGGRTVVAGSGDRPFIGCDASGKEALRGRVYVSAKREVRVFGHPGADWHPELDMAAVSISRDRGAHFDFPRFFLTAPEKELLNVVSDMLVAPDGRLILTLQTFSAQEDLRGPLLTGSYSTIVSNDGGRNFSEPRHLAEWRTFGHASEGKSLFGFGGAHLAMDTSAGPSRGRLYATWLDVEDGRYQVMSAASADGGSTWSAPVRVNDNRNETDASNPGIAVSGDGVVGISWNDRRGDPTDRCYQLFFAASVDGASTFSANRRIGEGFTCPIGLPGPASAADSAVDPVNSEYRFKNGGDTQGIAGLTDGGFHLAWINGASGQMQLWSTVVTVKKDRLRATLDPVAESEAGSPHGAPR